MEKRKKSVFQFLIIFFIYFLITFIVYHLTDKKPEMNFLRAKAIPKGRKYLDRGIDTPFKKWLNGHLGVFFNFKYLGNLNWLIIPLAVYFFATVKKRKRWQVALTFVYLITFLLIAIKGYYNVRYQLTLFPFTISVMLFLLWEFIKHKKFFFKVFCFSFLSLVCLYNVYHYFDHYNFFWEARVNLKNPLFPYKLIGFINKIKATDPDSKILTLNQPIFYYYCRNKAIDHLNPTILKSGLFHKQGNRNKLYSILRNELKVNFILTDSLFNKIFQPRMLSEFLECECKLVLRDQGRILYRIRNTFLDEELKSSAYEKFNVWKGKAEDPQNTSPSLVIQGSRGKFNFHFNKTKGENFLVVNNIEPRKDGERLLQFGYTANLKGFNIKVPEGKYIQFLVKLKLSKNLINKKNYIFIQDYDGKWERKWLFFSSPYWRSYLISKKIRSGSTNLCLGIVFEPQSSKDKIMVKDIKIFISEKAFKWL